MHTPLRLSLLCWTQPCSSSDQGIYFSFSLLTEKCWKRRLLRGCRRPTLQTSGQRNTVWGSASVRWTARCRVLAPRRCPKRWPANIEHGWQRHRTKRPGKEKILLMIYWTIIVFFCLILYDYMKGLTYCIWMMPGFAPSTPTEMQQQHSSASGKIILWICWYVDMWPG